MVVSGEERRDERSATPRKFAETFEADAVHLVVARDRPIARVTRELDAKNRRPAKAKAFLEKVRHCALTDCAQWRRHAKPYACSHTIQPGARCREVLKGPFP